MTPPRLCDLGESVPACYDIQHCSLLACSPQLLGTQASFLSRPISLFSLDFYRKSRTWLQPLLLAHFELGWQWDIVKAWKSTDFLPSASWTERSKDQRVSIYIALPRWVPSFRNHSGHTCLSSYPGGGEVIPGPVLPHPGPLHTPKAHTPPPGQASRESRCFPQLPTPTLPEKTHLCQVKHNS